MDTLLKVALLIFWLHLDILKYFVDIQQWWLTMINKYDNVNL